MICAKVPLDLSAIAFNAFALPFVQASVQQKDGKYLVPLWAIAWVLPTSWKFQETVEVHEL